MENVVIITGAGISAESGIETFRGSGGLWNEHRIEDVASPEGWAKDRRLVLDFYNKRRREVLSVKPNLAHKALVELESKYDVTVITQNIDDLHERAGSQQVIHLHGEIMKARSSVDPELIYDTYGNDIKLGDKCEKGSQLRPHVVWFGEQVPLYGKALEIVNAASKLLVVGTSLSVYPAASLITEAKEGSEVVLVDPLVKLIDGKVHVVNKNATIGVPEVISKWLTIHD